MPSHVMGYIYLIHFERPYCHARHYLGWSTDLMQRLTAHRAGTGARLMAVITEAEIGWTLARVWTGDRFYERQLKIQGGHSRKCPICQGKSIGYDIDLFLATGRTKLLEVIAS